MAFTRKFLKALGLEDTAIEQIMDTHIEVVDGLKEQLKTLQAKAETVDNLQKQLEEATAEDWKAQYDAVKKQFDDYKADQSSKATRQAKEAALAAIAKEVGISEKRIPAILKATDIDSYELGEDGTITDRDGAESYFKTEWADFIVTTGAKGADTSTPPAGGMGGKSLSEMSLDERMKLKAEHPEQYAKMKG